jgi:hypothetical protein
VARAKPAFGIDAHVEALPRCASVHRDFGQRATIAIGTRAEAPVHNSDNPSEPCTICFRTRCSLGTAKPKTTKKIEWPRPLSICIDAASNDYRLNKIKTGPSHSGPRSGAAYATGLIVIKCARLRVAQNPGSAHQEIMKVANRYKPRTIVFRVDVWLT